MLQEPRKTGAARAEGVARLACRVCGFEDLESAGRVQGYTFVACPACAFTFTPDVTPETLAKQYADGYNGPDEGAPEAGWSLDEPEFLAPGLDRLPDRALRILDFGTGQSRSPDALRAHGHRVLAVDVAAPAPGREHPDRLTGHLLDLTLPVTDFDLVYAFQVFEHLPEPRPVLDRLLALTRPGGLVLVHTDMETTERFEHGFEDWWYVLPPDHCAFYRHRTLERYVEDTPHRIVFTDEKSVVIENGVP